MAAPYSQNYDGEVTRGLARGPATLPCFPMYNAQYEWKSCPNWDGRCGSSAPPRNAKCSSLSSQTATSQYIQRHCGRQGRTDGVHDGPRCAHITSSTSSWPFPQPDPSPQSPSSVTPCVQRSLGCRVRGKSPISSRKRVPRSAISKRPIFSEMAPVNAPFSCPNSSLELLTFWRSASQSLSNITLDVTRNFALLS